MKLIITPDKHYYAQLTRVEWNEIERLGKQRTTLDRQYGWKPKDTKGTKLVTSYYSDIIGITGEYIITSIIGSSMNLTTPGQPDTELDGCTIEIKTTNKPTSTSLIFSKEQPFNAMLAVVVAPTETPLKYELVGYTTNEQFTRKSRPFPQGKRGSERIMRRGELYPISRFFDRFPPECEVQRLRERVRKYEEAMNRLYIDPMDTIRSIKNIPVRGYEDDE